MTIHNLLVDTGVIGTALAAVCFLGTIIEETAEGRPTFVLTTWWVIVMVIGLGVTGILWML